MTKQKISIGHTASLFVVSAPADEPFQKELEKHLAELKRQGIISIESNQTLLAGTDRALTIEEQLKQSDIIVLLISVDFLSSDELYLIMEAAVQKKDEGRAHVIPILLRLVARMPLPIRALPFLPSNGVPVAQWNDRDRVFAHIAEEIGKLLPVPYPFANERIMTQSHHDYLQWLIKSTAWLDTRGIYSAPFLRQIKLEEIYIILNARPEHFQPEPFSFPTSKTETAKQTLSLPLPEILSRHTHLVILGEPGSGKTTLLHYLALTHARILCDDTGTQREDARFPILLRLSDYVQHGMHVGKSLREYLVDDCARHECVLPNLADILEGELRAGRCLILLDGLDEVVRTEDRQKLVRQLEAFVRCYDGVPNRFLCTSRRAGYQEAPLSSVFEHYTLQQLEEKDIRRFLEAWYLATEAPASVEENAPLPTRRQRIRHQVDMLLNTIQTAPGVYQLASNPLLLCLLTQQLLAGKQPPRQRVELYEQVTETLMQTWRVAQGVSLSAVSEMSSLFDLPYTTRLLSYLAYWLHEKQPAGSVHEQEINEVLGKELVRLTNKSWREGSPDVEKEIKRFLQMVRDHTGILVEEAPRRYRFAHLTFEEYYAACHLASGKKKLAKFIRACLHNGNWQEPILLALGIIGRESQEKAHVLLETAILAQGDKAQKEGFFPAPYEALLGRDYLFALRCLGDDIPASPALAEQLLERLFCELTQRAPPGRFQKYQKALAQHLGYIETSIYQGLLIPYLVSYQQEADVGFRLWSLYSLGRIGRASASVEVRQILLEASQEKDSSIRSAALWGLSQVPGNAIVDLLLDALRNDPDALVRQYAAEYLGTRWEASSQITRTLLDTLGKTAEPGNALLRWAIVKSLGQRGDASPEVILALIALLPQDMPFFASHESTLQSLRQLSHISPTVASTVAHAFQDAAPFARTAIAQVLKTFEHASPEIIAALENVPSESLSRAIPQVPCCARQSYWLPAQREVLLLCQLNDSRHWVRWEAAKALGYFEELSDEADLALRSLLDDEEASVRAQAVRTLNAFETSEGLIQLFIQKLSQDTDLHVRAQIVRCLGDDEQPSEEVLQAFLQAASDREEYVRICAIENLAPFLPDSPEMQIHFLNMLRDDTAFGVRWEIVKAFNYLQVLPEQAESAIVQTFLVEKHEVVRCDCAQLLGQSGSKKEPAIQALLKGLSDEDAQVRQACSQALVHLGHRFPETVQSITMQLAHLVQQYRENRAGDRFVLNPPWDMTYDALWFLVNGSSF